jgi:glycosyltransferase involved in cell wall biosynthesis
MTSPIRYSIIIAFHNHRSFVKDAVDSAIAIQKGRHDVEIIAVDDGSIDGTVEVLREYAQIIRTIGFKENRGACAARNCGANLASGEYLLFLDGDDAFLPWCLEAYEVIVQQKKPKVILASQRWFKGTLPTIRAEDFPRRLQIVEYEDCLRRDRGFGNSASALVVDRASFMEVGGWTAQFFPCEDHDLLMRLWFCGPTIQILNPPTVLHRSHASYTVQNLQGCLKGARDFVESVKNASYYGGPERNFEKYSLAGGVVFFWAKRAIQNKLYLRAVALLLCGWKPLAAAVLRRVLIRIRGRRQQEAMPMRNRIDFCEPTFMH